MEQDYSFDNVILGRIAICSKQEPKEAHLKALSNEGAFPILYLEKEKLDLETPLFADIVRAFPAMTGLIFTIHYRYTYY